MTPTITLKNTLLLLLLVTMHSNAHVCHYHLLNSPSSNLSECLSHPSLPPFAPHKFYMCGTFVNYYSECCEDGLACGTVNLVCVGGEIKY